MIDSAPDQPDLHFELHPETPFDGAVPVVFTHGWLNDGPAWSEAIEAVTRHTARARCLSWDLRGHGRSAAAEPGRYRRNDALDDLARMIDRVGSPAILAGHSLGGYLSLTYAIERPDEVAGLVLVAAGPGFRSDDSREQWNDSVRAMAATADIPEGMEEISMHVDAMVIDRLSEITVPAAVVVGEHDSRFQASAAVFEKYLNVIHHEIAADAGHMVHVKKPEAVAAAVAAVVDAR